MAKSGNRLRADPGETQAAIHVRWLWPFQARPLSPRLLEVSPQTSQRLLIAIWILVLLYVGLAAFPSIPGIVATGLDPSWVLGMSLAHQMRLTPGTEFVFSYGPLGYLSIPHPGAAAHSDAPWFHLAMHVVWLLALAYLGWLLSNWQLAIWCTAVAGLTAAFDPFANKLQETILLFAILPLLEHSVRRYFQLILLAFISSLALMVKFNIGMQGLCLCGFLLALAWWEERPQSRRMRWAFGAAVCALLLMPPALYLITTGRLDTFFPFLKNSLELASGYSENMSFIGPLWQVSLALAALAGLFIAIPWISGSTAHLWRGLMPAAILAYFSFKEAMVRQDGHALPFHFRLAAISLLPMVSTRSGRDRRAFAAFQILSIFMALQISREALPSYDTGITERLRGGQALRSIRAFWRWDDTWKGLRAQNRANLDALRMNTRFHQIIGANSIDVAPWNIDLVAANGWHWSPRPIIQSYAAFTPALDRLNAESLERPRAPRFILASWDLFDEHPPFFCDALYWRTLLNWYEARLSGSGVVMLERRPQPRFRTSKVDGPPYAVTWGTETPVPQSDDLVLMAADIDQSLSGAIRNLLYRVDPIYLNLVYASGRRTRARVVRANLREGVIVNRMPRDLNEFVSLARDHAPLQDRVVSVRFEAVRPWQYRPQIRVHWLRLLYRDPGSRVSPADSSAKLIPLWLPDRALPRAVDAKLTRGPEGLRVFPTTTDPQLFFDVGPALGRVQRLVVRARFEKGDRVDLFFGSPNVVGGLAGIVPVAGQWLDVSVNVSRHPLWKSAHGAIFRFDPSSDQGVGTTIEIAGVWGDEAPPPEFASDVEFFPVPTPLASSDRRK